MNRKILLSALVFGLFISAKAFCEISPEAYMKKFSNCSKYIYNADNKISAILGWSARKCYYQEFSGVEEINCAFKTNELKDISSAMKKERYDYKKGLSSLEGAKTYLNSQGICNYKNKVQEDSSYSRYSRY